MKLFLTKTLMLGLLAVLLLAGGAVLFAGNEQKTPPSLLEHLGPPEMSKVDPDKPLREQTRVFELAGRRFAIPIMYIDGRTDPGEHQENMLLEVIWPEMRAIWELKDKTEYDRVRKEEHRIGWMLLYPASTKASLEWQNENGVNGLTKFEPAGTYDGLEKGL